jgi:hypothetical protein
VQRFKARVPTNGITQPDGSVLCDDRMDHYDEFYLHQFQAHDGEDANETFVCAGVNHSTFGDSGDDLVQAMYAYDAVMAFALTLHDIAYTEGVCDPTPLTVLEHLQHDLFFVGLTGNVSFSTEFERQHFDVGGRDSSYVYSIVNYVAGMSVV